MGFSNTYINYQYLILKILIFKMSLLKKKLLRYDEFNYIFNRVEARQVLWRLIL